MVQNLRWWLILVLSIAAFAVCWLLGLVEKLWQVDSTKISFVILGVYAVVSAFVGWLTWSADWVLEARFRPACDFVPELMVELGLIGTVIGFLMMLGLAFNGIDLNNVQATQAALARMASGISVALTTTLVGLLCSTALKAQLVNLGLAVR